MNTKVCIHFTGTPGLLLLWVSEWVERRDVPSAVCNRLTRQKIRYGWSGIFPCRKEIFPLLVCELRVTVGVGIQPTGETQHRLPTTIVERPVYRPENGKVSFYASRCGVFIKLFLRDLHKIFNAEWQPQPQDELRGEVRFHDKHVSRHRPSGFPPVHYGMRWRFLGRKRNRWKWVLDILIVVEFTAKYFIVHVWHCG